MEKIVIENLCKSFDGKAVLKNFKAVINKGEVNCIMAPSGAGKTTLINILMGLLPADSGEILGLDKSKIRTVFQEDRLVESLSVYTNIKIATDKSRDDILHMLNRLLISAFENSVVGTMSGGEKRRVAIARALLSDSEFLILDEPLKGLDEETKGVVIDTLKECSAGKTVLLITHDKEEAIALNATNFIAI